MNKFPKKNKVLKICMWILLLPIMLTILILKSNKNTAIKIVCLLIVWTLTFHFIGIKNDNSETYSENDNKVTETLEDTTGTKKEAETKNTIKSKVSSKTEEENKKEEIEYHKDKMINKLITQYNKIAEFKIEPDTIRDGAYDFNAIVTCNGVYIMFYSNTEGVFIDYQLEANDDSQIYPLFRDFAQAFNSEVTIDEIQSGFDVVRTGNSYKDKSSLRSSYVIGGVECNYARDMLSNGQKRFIVKTYGSFKE